MNWDVFICAWAWHASSQLASKAKYDLLYYQEDEFGAFIQEEGEAHGRWLYLTAIRDRLGKELLQRINLQAAADRDYLSQGPAPIQRGSNVNS